MLLSWQAFTGLITQSLLRHACDPVLHCVGAPLPGPIARSPLLLHESPRTHIKHERAAARPWSGHGSSSALCGASSWHTLSPLRMQPSFTRWPPGRAADDEDARSRRSVKGVGRTRRSTSRERLVERIDRALVELTEIRSGTEPYLRRLREIHASDPPTAKQLCDVVVDVSADLYRTEVDPPTNLFEFSDGAFDVLFDAEHELTVLMHGLSRLTAANTRDNNYHRGFPARAGFDKGHAMAHAQGGREGGPNYFPQAPRVNRRLSPLGGLWRDIESYLAATPGLYCFVRLAYPAGVSTDVPAEVEYGVAADGQFRVVVFPNR
jgi:hypothetical protein